MNDDMTQSWLCRQQKLLEVRRNSVYRYQIFILFKKSPRLRPNHLVIFNNVNPDRSDNLSNREKIACRLLNFEENKTVKSEPVARLLQSCLIQSAVFLE
jgi:hypothetical protein